MTVVLALLAVTFLAACSTLAPSLPPPPVHPNGQALWRIVHDRCVPDQRDHSDPAPCALVSLSDGEGRGFVVLKDLDGVAQYLVMPTAKITGIEDPLILEPGATNYFAAAWAERNYVERTLGRSLDRMQLSIAVNSVYGRTQDQLHLHVDCLDATMRPILFAAPIPREGRWTSLSLKGHPYRVRWLDAAALPGTNPFRLLADTVPGAGQDMGAWTLALVGARSADGQDGFYILADRADPAAGDRGSAEELQDHACRL
jgi:CDP-diacylglycerol pyrophosphatase